MAKSKFTSLCGVYKIFCTASNKYYIGSSVNVFTRLRYHVILLNKHKHRNPHLQHAWNLYGSSCFEFSGIEESGKSELRELEQEWIMNLNALDDRYGYNIATDATRPTRGINTYAPASAETRAKISAYHLGRKHSAEHRGKLSATLMGHKLSKETKEKIGKANKGNKWSDEARARAGISHTGKLHTDDERAKISAGNKGKKRTPEMIEQIRARNTGRKQSSESIARRVRKVAGHYLITDPEYYTYDAWNLREFCRMHNISHCGLIYSAKSKQQHHKGWTCKRLDK